MMTLIPLRLCVAFLALLLLPTTALRAGNETREQVGTFRFALRDLPPLLQPVEGTHAYLVNGQNANWYDDKRFPRGTVRTEVNYLPGVGAGSSSVPMTTYRVVQVTEGSSSTTKSRSHHLEGDKYRINLYFTSGDLHRKPSEADLRKAFGRHIVFENEAKR